MKTHERAAAKTCVRCGVLKSIDEFYSCRNFYGCCKSCERAAQRQQYQRSKNRKLASCAEYRKRNSSRIKIYLSKWYKKNRERVLKRSKEYRATDRVKERERQRQKLRYAADRDGIQSRRAAYYRSSPLAKQRFDQYQKRYYRENTLKFTLRVAKRRAKKYSAMPQWADKKAIADIYKLAKERTLETGIKHVVDHVVPLQGRRVCGLHVETNLQVLSDQENLRKFNKFG